MSVGKDDLGRAVLRPLESLLQRIVGNFTNTRHGWASGPRHSGSCRVWGGRQCSQADPQYTGRRVGSRQSSASLPRLYGKPIPPFLAAISLNIPTGAASAAPSAGKPTSDAGPQTKYKSEPEDRILISEVEVVGCDGELQKIARGALTTRPNFAYTLDEVKADVRRVFATGWFSEVSPDAEDTRDGVKLRIRVRPNEEVRSLSAVGASLLPTSVVQQAFEDMPGRTLNLRSLQKAIATLDAWYHDRGIMGMVSDYTFDQGQLQLQCAEAVVGSITLRFLDPKTGQPAARPRTRPHIVTRHLATKPGAVYNLRTVRRDINAVYSTGLFEDVNVSTREADDSKESAPKVDLVLDLLERKTGGLSAGGGLSATAAGEGALPGLIGSFSYNERNLFGINQRLSISAEIGQVDKLFRITHTDPWVNSDPHRTSRTIHIMNNRTSGNLIHGRVEADGDDGTAGGPSGGGVLLGRLQGGVEWQRPLSERWSGSLSGSCQRTRCMDERGQPIAHDIYRAPITFSADNNDTALLTSATATYSDPRDVDTHAVLSIEQALPLRREWLHYTRFKARLDKAVRLGPYLGLYLRGRAGAVLGDLPPYEAFPIGGTNSVRGYAEGGVGSGRHSVEASAELRAPLPVKQLCATAFFDVGSDLGSGPAVIGDPAGVRGKPGNGYGFGGGVRVDSPVGPVRLEYAWNANREGRFHVGLGYG
ncbi:hypothetical protein Vretimale_18825 [Volvox reticuliferus]|uniref:Bacterial surface antigen (D15) domain-containing protein n=1 Tax=Volvox reticuliferus TaxID=1737510 RepID=A0A8J4LZ44_9CHLO|nr:hypothetical protein Vretifemale_18883 [Volvox reticuliferus]GIM16170.1 hypothetical protein Vretimale_18825 [Volvox reticuliferus]